MIHNLQILAIHKKLKWWVIYESHLGNRVLIGHNTKAFCDGYVAGVRARSDEYHATGRHSVARASDYLGSKK